MLSQIKIKNFKSIVDLTVDFSYAEKKAPNGYKTSDILPFLEPTKKVEDRVVPVMMFYGANASGKSNTFEVLSYFKRIVLSGLDTHYYKPNKLKELDNKTTIELQFYAKKEKYKYVLSYNNASILDESLFNKDNCLYSITNKKTNFNNIKTKAYNSKDLQNIYNIACIKEDFNTEKKAQINTFLEALTSKLPSLNKNLSNVFNFLKHELDVMPNNDIPEMFAIDRLAESEKEEDINLAFDRIARFIKKLDIDIERFEYERKEVDMDINNIMNKSAFNRKRFTFKKNSKTGIITQDMIVPYHKNDKGEEVPFDFTEESDGTQISFGLIGVIINTLDTGGVLVVDEFDRSLHPILLNALIKLFKEKEYNKNNAQLILTTHSTDILENNIYRISEFSIVNKSKKNGSCIKRLSDFEDARNDINFRKRYLKGHYLGIPYTYN